MRKQKTSSNVILFLCVTRIGIEQRHDIMFITNDYKCHYKKIWFQQHIRNVNYKKARKINEIFTPYLINENTNIVLQDSVDRLAPLNIYFNILQPYTRHSLVHVSFIKMITRINYKYRLLTSQLKKYNGTKVKINKITQSRFINRIWDYVRDRNLCPWISKTIERDILMEGKKELMYQKRIRIALFYAFIKKSMVIKVQNSIKKRKQRELLEQQKLTNNENV